MSKTLDFPYLNPNLGKILVPCVPRNVDHAYHGQVLSAIIAPPDPGAVDGLPSRLLEDILCVFLDAKPPAKTLSMIHNSVMSGLPVV